MTRRIFRDQKKGSIIVIQLRIKNAFRSESTFNSIPTSLESVSLENSNLAETNGLDLGQINEKVNHYRFMTFLN